MCWRSISWLHVALLSFILLLAAGVRCCNLAAKGLWTDEYLSLECSSGWARSDRELSGRAVVAPDLITLHHAKPWFSIWSSIGNDENHPPLYFMLLRVWRELFGDTPAALRSLSVVASLIAIVLLFALGVEIHSPRAGLWACLLMAVAAPQIEQAQDARAYILVTTACLAAALALVRIDRLGPTWPRCICLFLAALIAPLMHYMAFATLAAMLVYSVVVMRGSARKWAIISLSTCVATFALLWGPHMLQQHYRMIDDTTWLVYGENSHITSVLGDLCSMPVRLFLDLDLLDSPFACLGCVALLLPLVYCRRNRETLLCWIWLVVPVVIGLVIDLSTHRRSLSMIRYTLAAAPGIYLMLGLLAAHMRRVGWIPTAFIAGCCAICIPSDYLSSLPDYREVSRFIARSSKPSDPVVFVASRPDSYSSEGLLSVMYYLAGQNHPLYVLDRAPNAALMQELQKSNHICVISDGATALDRPIVPGLAIDRSEFLAGIAVVGTEDPAAQGARLRLAKFTTDPVLKLALGMR
jgi:uncharacterized membrane protein